MTRPSAVIFDMDGVVLDSEPIYRRCWQRAAADLGFHIPDELYARLIGRNNGDSEAIVRAEMGDPFPMENFRREWQSYWADQVRSHGVPLKRGVEELLNFLEEHGLRKAIATSTDREMALPSLGKIRLRFDAMITGDEIERGKPAPDIFLKTAEALGVPPQACWVIEDSEAGVRAAHAAGMFAVIVPDLCTPSPDVCSLAACVCESLHEVRERLEIEIRRST